MADFYEGYYPATVLYTDWIHSSRKGTLGLSIAVRVRNAQGAEQDMTGYIWFSEKTMRPQTRRDGTEGRSMVERQLNALGYKGPMEDARTIGRIIDLADNETTVHLKNETYQGDTRLKIAFFVEGQGNPKATEGDVDDFFDNIGGTRDGAQRTEAEDNRDSTPAPPASPADLDDPYAEMDLEELRSAASALYDELGDLDEAAVARFNKANNTSESILTKVQKDVQKVRVLVRALAEAVEVARVPF